MNGLDPGFYQDTRDFIWDRVVFENESGKERRSSLIERDRAGFLPPPRRSGMVLVHPVLGSQKSVNYFCVIFLT